MLELVVGGARSGKSRYARHAAEAHDGEHVFIATARAGDAEMAQRIEAHRRERGEQWRLVEAPLGLARQLEQYARQDGNVVLVDCLTLWISNWLCGDARAGWPGEKQAFLDALDGCAAHVYLVSNETGMGVVPMDRLSREFVDEAGALHQALAAVADRVVTVTLGIAQVLKGVAHD